MYFTVNKTPITSTLQTSAAATTMFCPLGLQVRKLGAKAGKNEKYVQLLHYFAFPLDSVIQAVAMPVFTLIDHFRDIKADSDHGRKKWVAVKLCATIVSLPLKELAAVALSTGYIFNGAASLIFPWATFWNFFDAFDPATTSEFFKAVNEYEKSYQAKPFSIPPLRVLSAPNQEIQIKESSDVEQRKRLLVKLKENISSQMIKENEQEIILELPNQYTGAPSSQFGTGMTLQPSRNALESNLYLKESLAQISERIDFLLENIDFKSTQEKMYADTLFGRYFKDYFPVAAPWSSTEMTVSAKSEEKNFIEEYKKILDGIYNASRNSNRTQARSFNQGQLRRVMATNRGVPFFLLVFPLFGCMFPQK